MDNSITNMRPHLVSEWSERNSPLSPDVVSYGSNKLYWWKGSCGHEWQASAKARSTGERCPICSGARVIAGINDLNTTHPSLAEEWLSKNKKNQQRFPPVLIRRYYGTESAGMNGRQ